MSDEYDPNKGEVTLCKNRSLTLRRSGLVKGGLKLIEQPKKQEVNIAIVSHDSLVTFLISTHLKDVIDADNYDLKLRHTPIRQGAI